MSESTKSASALPPVPLDQVLVIINRYLKSSATFLQDFSAQCDAKLSDIAEKTDKLDLELKLLESKLDWVDIKRENGTGGKSNKSQATELKGKTETTIAKLTRLEIDSKLEGVLPKPPIIDHESEEPPSTSKVPKVEDKEAVRSNTGSDPRLTKYQSMLKVGIPKDAVIIKMQIDGLGDLVSNL